MHDKKENLNNPCCLIVDNGLLETVCFRFYLFLPPFQLRKEFSHGGVKYNKYEVQQPHHNAADNLKQNKENNVQNHRHAQRVA